MKDKVSQFDSQVAAAKDQVMSNSEDLTPLDDSILESISGRGGPTFGSWSRVVEN